ncbi:TolB family protein [Cesiribacter andamanensis]|nr:PD40 domain-containing protein [Cesiribacter andamanensis]
MNSHIFFGSALLLACLAGTALAQQPGFTPQKAPATINSTYAEINPMLSPDGSELYFVRVNHPANGYGEGDSQDIWYSKKGADGEWSEAIRIPELNLARYNAVVGFVDGGKTLMIMGRFTKSGDFWSKRGFSLLSRSESGQWGAPRAVQIASYARKNKGLYSTAYLSADGNQLLMSYHKRHNSKHSDLFVSQAQANGKFSAPKKIRTLDDDNELAPFLSADGKTLYYTSNRAGSQDILVAERQGDNWRNWTAAKLPNEAINTPGWEAYFRTNAQGSMGYYAATQGSEHSDIYFVKLYEENPYILVSGRVLNTQNGQPLPTASGLRLFANDSLQQSLSVQADAPIA